jgi:hypothetical protein
MVANSRFTFGLTILYPFICKGLSKIAYLSRCWCYNQQHIKIYLTIGWLFKTQTTA